MFDDEKRIYGKMGGNPQRAESELEHTKVMDALHIMRRARWLVRQKRECAGRGDPPAGSECAGTLRRTRRTSTKKTCRTDDRADEGRLPGNMRSFPFRPRSGRLSHDRGW